MIESCLQEEARLREFPKGAQVFRQGDVARGVFYVLEGEVQLCRFGRRGERIIVHRARAGEYFAEASLESKRYHCDAIVMKPARLLEVPAARFRHVLRSDPGFAQRWSALLSRQLQIVRARAERMSLVGAVERVRHYLATAGSGPRSEVELRGSIKDLAAELGLTHETLYRTLARMQKSGEIEREGSRLRRRRPSV
jgi:CRP-like cAMP-binding protein